MSHILVEKPPRRAAATEEEQSAPKLASNGVLLSEEEGKFQVLVPVYNEGENICALYRNLVKEGIAFHTLKFVYDTDDDTTLPYIAELEKEDERICSEKNEYGRGVIHAFRWAFERCESGPVIVLMGDNSDKLSIIPEMIRLWQQGAAIVCPSRYMRGGEQHGGGVLKSTMSRIAGTSLKLFGFPTSDATNNFKLYDGEWVRQQTIESKGGFEISIELCCKAYGDGREIRELPTVWRDRTMGKSNFKLVSWLPLYLKWYFRIIGLIGRKKLGLR